MSSSIPLRRLLLLFLFFWYMSFFVNDICRWHAVTTHMGDIYFVQSDVATRVTLSVHASACAFSHWWEWMDEWVSDRASWEREWVRVCVVLWNSFKVDALLGLSFYLFLFFCSCSFIVCRWHHLVPLRRCNFFQAFFNEIVALQILHNNVNVSFLSMLSLTQLCSSLPAVMLGVLSFCVLRLRLSHWQLVWEKWKE